MKRIVALIAFTCVLSAASAADAQRKPNILFVFSDDQRADTIHALGNPHITTPTLDRLAQRGTANPSKPLPDPIPLKIQFPIGKRNKHN